MSKPTSIIGDTIKPRWVLIAIISIVTVAVISITVVVMGGGSKAENQANSGTEASESESLKTPVIPHAEIDNWGSLRVRMEGGLPEGTIYSGAESNPHWAKINRFTGEVHYDPKDSRIELGNYDITVVAELPDGEVMDIDTTVEIVTYESLQSTSAPEPLEAPTLPRTTVRPGESVTVELEGGDLPEGTVYSDTVGPGWMSVDRDTGEVTFNLERIGGDVSGGVRDILITAWTPNYDAVSISSEVEIVVD